MTGLTLDSGMLIGLERRKQRAVDVYRRAKERGARLTVPTPIIGEWWRGRSDIREDILLSVVVEPLSEAVAKLAGEAIARVAGATPVDAYVMASAAIRGDDVLTSDVDDLTRLQAYFRRVRVFGV